jgi:phosphoribosylformimino-5-aminoimidazole carboxamide ribotide isomerase
MLIPSIDLQGGCVVQLVQGERLAISSSDVDGWIRRFDGFPAVQLIDLDAAKSEGTNAELVARITRRLPCRVGGGIRTIERALALLRQGARKVILGSALFADDAADLQFAESAAREIGTERLIAAVDAKGGMIVVRGWRHALALSPVDAIRQLEPFVDEFLFTNVDREGLMQGIDRETIARIRNATRKELTVAGGVTTREEVDWLAALRIDAVVGMALYTGVLEATPPHVPPSNRDEEEMP